MLATIPIPLIVRSNDSIMYIQKKEVVPVMVQPLLYFVFLVVFIVNCYVS